ncbi:hypothetical protein ISN44_As08g018560 [Arabidopsis suecica]|uniref:Defensin-like domain-containing protein n=1 Tax=Arabidopsis suecica TaxID=45249 RepID=A0A8T2B5D8_ARASU|nr:hypothetical protein ISN44_As08g018560 [Arabidopsis suecica]
MGSTKALETCLLVIIFAVMLFNYNVLTLEIKKVSYDNCRHLCSDRYGWFECMNDCEAAGYINGGQCASPSPKDPLKCCCQK